jgi:hypothetical protein
LNSNLFEFEIVCIRILSTLWIFFHILNLFRFEICLNSKSNHNPNLFRFNFIQIWNLFISNFFHIQNLFKFWLNFVHNSNFVWKGEWCPGDGSTYGILWHCEKETFKWLHLLRWTLWERSIHPNDRWYHAWAIYTSWIYLLQLIYWFHYLSPFSSYGTILAVLL